MTFRAKPVVKRSHKPAWESQDRRNFYLNVGFGIIVVVSVLILVIALALSYYNDHLASVGSVDGQSISKDELVERGKIETWRLDEAERRIRTAAVAGHLTEQQASLQSQFIAQQRERIVPVSLERLIDNRIQAGLAATEGVTVTDADIDARLLTEATTTEGRHAWVIEVEPEITDGEVDPTAAQIAAAKSKAEAALRDLKAGKPWDDIAKTVSTDTSTAPQAGDLGWLQSDDSQTDEAFLTALFAAEANTPTAVTQGEDGIFRIGRATEIAPESVDSAYSARVVNDGLDLAAYREVIRGDVIREKLEDKIVAEATKPGPQRDVAEIFLADAGEPVPGDAVRVRHILYSPKDDPEAASNGDIPETDPSWAAAETEAKASFDKLTADPTTFDATARSESDETSALGANGSGGKLPGYVTPDSGYVESFKTAVLAPGLEDGEILAPFKSEFGWHVVQIVNHPPDRAYLAEIKAKADAGADFAALARDTSDAETSGRGGDVGFVAKGQLDTRLTDAIFATPVGETTDVITITGEGNADVGAYLYKVLAEETRTPEGSQLDDIRQTAFSDWYGIKKGAVPVTRDPNYSSPIG